MFAPINLKNRRIMKLLLKLSFFTFLLISTSSCTRQVELSSKEAYDILLKNYKNPCSKGLLFSFNSLDKNYDSFISDVSLAQDEGIVTVTKRFISGIGGGGRYEISMQPTREMKSEFFMGGNKYRVADGYIVEILGISHDNDINKATVRFSYKYQPNQIYKIRGRTRGKRKECSTETFEDEATFTLYDTGWKLDK